MLSTTSLLVEHLIAGVMACIWIVLMMLCVYPVSPSMLPVLIAYKYLILIVLSVLSYPIGMIVDNIADSILMIRSKKYKNAEDYLSVTELIYHLKDDNIKDWFTYNRFKIRIMRSCWLNALIACVIMTVCTVVCRTDYSLPVAIGSLLLSVTSYMTWHKEVKATYKNVEKWRKMI